MPLIPIKKTNKLDEIINSASFYFTESLLFEFSGSLGIKGLLVPRMSDIDIGLVSALVLDAFEKYPIQLSSFKSKWPWSKMRAYNNGNKIAFNSRHKHTVKTIVKTLAHELVHCADNHSEYSFGHGSNFNQHRKQDCAPQVFARLYVEFLESKGFL